LKWRITRRSLRHTVRTVLSLRGHRDAAVGQLLGQANPATLSRYNHAQAAERTAIADDLGALLGRIGSRRGPDANATPGAGSRKLG
jgi:integrase